MRDVVLEIIERLARRRRARLQADLPFDPPLAVATARPRTPQTRRRVDPPETRVPFAAGVRELELFIADAGGDRIRLVRTARNTVWVDLVARDAEVYQLRVRATRYLVAPPDAVFVNALGADGDFTAWPRDALGTPFRTGARGLCTPPTAWFYAAHPERRYRPGEGTLAAVVGTIYAALQAPEYRGRQGGAPRRSAFLARADADPA